MPPLKAAIVTRSYHPTYFKVADVVCPEYLQVYGDRAFMFMDARILWTADALYEYFGGIFINNEHLKYCGLRPFSHPSALPHKLGCAIDFHSVRISHAEIRKEIIGHQDHPAFKYICRMEDDTETWVHVDTFNTGSDKIETFKA